MYKKLYYLLFVLLAFQACEEPINLDINEEPKLVLVSNFTNSNKLVVYVSLAKDITQPSEFTYIVGATVRVYEDDQLIEILQDLEGNDKLNLPPGYESINLIPTPGKIYKITVNVNGFEAIEAYSSIPERTNMDASSFDNSVVINGDQLATVDFDLNIGIEDRPGEANFYHLLFYQEMTFYRINSDGDTIREMTTTDIPIHVNAVDENAPLTMYLDNKSFLFTDETFDGQNIAFDFVGNYSFSKNKFLAGNFIVELRSVSEDYYRYHSTLNLYDRSQQDPLSEPPIIFNNIKNGCGIFAGYSYVVKTFEISD